MKFNDILPFTSGVAAIGVNMSAGDVLDSTISPFNRIHVVSGVFHDELMGQSGVLRYSREQAAFQISVNGGLTFANLSAGGVDSVGVSNGANLTGHVDFASASSGFIAITDNAGASPISWAVDNLGLSGLWRFPTQGFNGRVVNALTDFNGTEAQGVISVVGASGIVVDLIGNTLTVTNANVVPRCFSATFGSSLIWTVNHNLNSLNVIVQCYDNDAQRNQFVPDEITVTNANTVTIRQNSSTAGLVVVMACY